MPLYISMQTARNGTKSKGRVFNSICSLLKSIRDSSSFQRVRGKHLLAHLTLRSEAFYSNLCRHQVLGANGRIQGISGETWINPVDANPCRTDCCGRETCQGIGNFPGPTLMAGQMKPSLLTCTTLQRVGKCTSLESSREPWKCGFPGAAKEGTVMADTGHTAPPPKLLK